jgi:Mg/Co/Ni transporter MgtE/sporulation protein YlmC with PRC-barrel domain
MLYLSELLDLPIIDAAGQQIGTIADLAISTAEAFPRVVAVSFRTNGQTAPSIFSWQRFVSRREADGLHLSLAYSDLEYSYLKEDELLLARDLMGEQIVDVQSRKVAKVSDLKLSDAETSSGVTLRLLGAQVADTGQMRAFAFLRRLFKRRQEEQLIAWDDIDLPGRDLSYLKLSGSHKRLNELHPADVADIIEQLEPEGRAAVFAHLDKEQAAEAIPEMEDEYQAHIITGLADDYASGLLAQMDPDDAADIIADLDATRAERLLRLMSYEDAETIRSLLGYPKHTAGGIMTPEVAVASADMTVADAVRYLRRFARDADDLHYVYLVATSDEEGKPQTHGTLIGVATLFELLMNDDDTPLADFALREVISVHPDDDQEDVAEMISKYNLLALPVVDSQQHLLGTVTVDDAFDVMEEEAEENLARATGRADNEPLPGSPGDSLLRRAVRALRWCFPQNISWVLIWVVYASLVYYVSTAIQIRDTGLTETLGFEALALAAERLPVFALALPLSLTTVRSSILKALEILTDLEPDRRPHPARRALCGAAIGAVSAALVLVVSVCFALAQYEVVEWAIVGLLFLALLISSVITALVAVALINRAVLADDAGKAISTRRIVTLSMLTYVTLSTLSIILVLYNALLIMS